MVSRESEQLENFGIKFRGSSFSIPKREIAREKKVLRKKEEWQKSSVEKCENYI